MTPPILIVDDEPAIRRLIGAALERAGFKADYAGNAAEAITSAGRPGVQLVLLDLGLPDRDGIELVPLLKAKGLALIVLTARDDTLEKVATLDLGADDYVTKPFDTDELLARVRVALRHRQGADAALVKDLGGIRIDVGSREVTKGTTLIYLSPKEFALLAELSRFPGRVLTHQHLLNAVWGEAHDSDVEYLRVAIRSLRKKLEDDPSQPRLLKNDPGVGYRLDPTKS